MDQSHVSFSKLASLTAHRWKWNDWKTILSFWNDQSSGALLVSGSVILIRAVNRFMSTEWFKSHLPCINNPPGHLFFKICNLNLLLQFSVHFYMSKCWKLPHNPLPTTSRYPTLPKHTTPVVIGPCHLLQFKRKSEAIGVAATESEAWVAQLPSSKVTVCWNTYWVFP